MPSMDEYAPDENLALDVARLMNDEQTVEQLSRPKVAAILPDSILNRVIDKLLPKRRKAPDTTAALPGVSAAEIAKSKRRGPMF